MIDGICCSYLWSGEGQITNKALVAWERTRWPKSAGGMRLPNIQLWNQAAVAKMCWNLANKADKLWIKWIHNFYIKDQCSWIPHSQASWMAKKIMGERNIVDRCNSVIAGRGA